MADINDKTISDAYNTLKAGRGQDATALGQQAGNPWLANIANDYQSIFGRMPTTQEVAQATPAYSSQAGSGGSFVANLYQEQQNTPEALNKANQDKALKEAPQHFDAVNQQFQNLYGRAATQDELNHFGSLLSSGTTDAYGLQQFLQQQPEYQSKQNEQMRQGLSSKMAANDKRQFSEQILPSIQEAYAKQGRSFDSSAFSNSATLAAQQQNTQREGFLTNLEASQYGGVQDRAYQDYANQLANQKNLTNSNIQAQYQGVQNSINRSNQLQDYNIQNQLYQQYLGKYGKRSGVSGAIGGASSGAMIGSAFGPWGTGIGAVAGGLGGYFGSQNGSY